MNKLYKEAELEIIELLEDVIITSTGDGENGPGAGDNKGSLEDRNIDM